MKPGERQSQQLQKCQILSPLVRLPDYKANLTSSLVLVAFFLIVMVLLLGFQCISLLSQGSNISGGWSNFVNLNLMGVVCK